MWQREDRACAKHKIRKPVLRSTPSSIYKRVNPCRHANRKRQLRTKCPPCRQSWGTYCTQLQLSPVYQYLKKNLNAYRPSEHYTGHTPVGLLASRLTTGEKRTVDFSPTPRVSSFTKTIRYYEPVRYHGTGKNKLLFLVFGVLVDNPKKHSTTLSPIPLLLVC